ncbi:MAG: NHL repeat containing protein [Candidatus Magnetoglobus multicellularis str. Araruama]|uniref:NHL repeat containing protein n=1 Tax=Candidatus Magnetoglobus multicellularis str. Araruama TaxID=890399 RepID=A0A1V1PC50_9BACT|nr:MAG: NHL repeat containing protein [Candidatus Magnetoglobus multicellularis str. Araruama]
MFIVDRGNHAIRKVDRKGIITTLIGNGFPGQCGFPTDDLMTNCLNDPSGIAVDSDNILYISDSKNNRIVKLNINDESTSCAINADLNSPAGLSINKDNILYVADLGNNRIQKIDQENNFDTYADNIDSPTDIVIDSINNAYTFITSQHQVLSINKDKKITVIAGTGSSSCNHEDEDPENSTLKTPVALALYEQEKLFVADNCNRIVQIHLQDNTFSLIAGNGKSTFCGDDGPALSASLNGPFDVASDQWNNIYVADTNNHRIRKITPDGIITTIAGNDNPGYTGDGGPAINASLNYPHDVAIDLYGNVYIADTNNHCIRVVWQNNIFNEVHKEPGTIETLAGNPDGISLNSPKGISVDISGYIYIADTGNNAIKKVNIETRELITIANGFNAPHDVAVNQQRKVYVADTLNNKIKIVSPDGRMLQVSVTEPSLTFPTCIDLDAKNFYIVDKGNHCIRKVPLSSIESHPQIQTIAGNGVSGFSGENWNPISASLNSPTGVAVAADGHIVLVDSGNNLIRKIVSEEYPNWIVNTTDLKHLGNIIASVYFKGYPTGNMGDKISCFINDECNGVAYPIKTIKGTRFFISVWGTGFEGGLIHFKYFHNADKIIYPIKQHIWVQELSDNDHTIDNPKIFEIIHVMDFPEKIINLTSENINLTSENNNQKLTITSLNTKIKVLDNEKDNLNSIVDSQSITIITLESIVDSQSLTINTLENEVVELENIVDSQSYSIYSLSSYSLTLSAGWHLLSSLNVEGITLTTEPPNCITAIYQFNSDTESYQKIEKLTPTQGFWIKLKQKCRLILSPPPDSMNLMQ